MLTALVNRWTPEHLRDQRLDIKLAEIRQGTREFSTACSGRSVGPLSRPRLANTPPSHAPDLGVRRFGKKWRRLSPRRPRGYRPPLLRFQLQQQLLQAQASRVADQFAVNADDPVAWHE